MPPDGEAWRSLPLNEAGWMPGASAILIDSLDPYGVTRDVLPGRYVPSALPCCQACEVAGGAPGVCPTLGLEEQPPETGQE
jgi:hypothetical protein